MRLASSRYRAAVSFISWVTASASRVIASHCLTRSISSPPIASMSFAAASYSLTTASADSLPISVAPSRCSTQSGIDRAGVCTLGGAKLTGRCSRSGGLFRTCVSISRSRSTTLKTCPVIGLTITSTPLVTKSLLAIELRQSQLDPMLCTPLLWASTFLFSYARPSTLYPMQKMHCASGCGLYSQNGVILGTYVQLRDLIRENRSALTCAKGDQ